jgi:hypothetical protein
MKATFAFALAAAATNAQTVISTNNECWLG